MDLLRNACSIATGPDEGVHLASPQFVTRRLQTGHMFLATKVSLRPKPLVTRMLPRLLGDPKRWLECAADMRLVAAELTDSDGKVIALRLAKDLEWFADWVSLRKNGPTTTRRS